MSRKRRKGSACPTCETNSEWARNAARRTGAVLRERPLPEGKVSDAVAEFAEPLVIRFVESNEDHVHILTFACTLWNLALIKKVSGERFPDEENDVMPRLALPPFMLEPDEALNLLSFMYNRWDQDFSWCKRIIMDKRIVEKKGELDLSIISAPMPVDKLDVASVPGRK